MSKNKSNGAEEKICSFYDEPLRENCGLLVVGLGVTTRVTVQGMLQKVYWIVVSNQLGSIPSV